MFGKTIDFVKAHSPEVLSAAGVVGLATTAVLSARGYGKASDILKDLPEDATRQEKVKAVWKCYIPAIASGIVSSACIVGSNVASERKRKAIAFAYTATTAAIKEFEDKVTDAFGEEKIGKIREKIASDDISEKHIPEDIVVDGDSESLCYDAWSGRYFNASIESIKKAQNDLNYSLVGGQNRWVTLNDFYERVGLAPVKAGGEFFWESDNPIELRTTAIITDSGKPCIHLDFANKPFTEK